MLAAMNNGGVNIDVHVSLQINGFNLGGRYPEEGFLGHMVALLLIFLGASILFSIVAIPVYILTSSE